MSKKDLLDKLQDPEYRAAFISDEIDIGLPMQLRAMRESRGWRQSFVAEKTETKQPRFSLMERPGYGKYSLNTLKKLAALFDVALIVSFVPWGEMIDFVESLSRRRLSILPFGDEQKRLSLAYSKQHRTNPQETRQLSFVFSTGATPAISPVSWTETNYHKTTETKEVAPIPPELLRSAYLASINCAGGGVYDTAN